MHPKVSIIVTVFKSEKYIEKCVHSLFVQTLDEIEYIFVNDSTPDNSVSIVKNILQEYPLRQSYVKIINQETNGGVSHARQIGICYATGEFIIHCDSDDWVDKDMYERLYRKAKETDADIVGCNFRHEFSDIQYNFRQQYSNSMEDNLRRLINGRIFPSLCTSLTKRELITEHNISFPIGLNMGEDLFFNLQLYLHATKIVGMDWAPYHYRHTENSSCVQRTRKSIDSDIAIAGMIERLMKDQKMYDKYAKDIEFRKFFSKLPLMEDLNNRNNYQDWLNIYPETNKCIWKYDQLDWKRKTELWLAAKSMIPAVKAFRRFLEWQHKIRHHLF